MASVRSIGSCRPPLEKQGDDGNGGLSRTGVDFRALAGVRLLSIPAVLCGLFPAEIPDGDAACGRVCLGGVSGMIGLSPDRWGSRTLALSRNRESLKVSTFNLMHME